MFIIMIYSSQDKSSDSSIKKLIKQILQIQIDKKDNYAILKNVEFDEQRPEKDVPPLPMPLSLFKPSQDYIIANFELVKKQHIEHKKYPRIVSVLKKSVRATIIIKYFLDLKVNLIVGKLLALALVVKKQLTKVITKDKTIQFHINDQNIENNQVATISHTQYSLNFLKAKMRLKNDLQVLTLLDLGAQIHVIIKKVMQNARLAIK